MGLIVWLVLPGLVLLIVECLIVTLIHTQKGCLTLPGLAAIALLLTLLGRETASGWDEIAWGIYVMMTCSGLIGSLLDCRLGWLFRFLKRRKSS